MIKCVALGKRKGRLGCWGGGAFECRLHETAGIVIYLSYRMLAYPVKKVLLLLFF